MSSVPAPPAPPESSASPQFLQNLLRFCLLGVQPPSAHFTQDTSPNSLPASKQRARKGLRRPEWEGELRREGPTGLERSPRPRVRPPTRRQN